MASGKAQGSRGKNHRAVRLFVLARTPAHQPTIFVRARGEAPDFKASLQVRSKTLRNIPAGRVISALRLPGSQGRFPTLRNTVPEIFPSVNSVLDACGPFAPWAIGAQTIKAKVQGKT